MTLVRRLARPCLAAMFVTGGFDSLSNPRGKVAAADPVAPPIAAKLPYLPEDTEQLVRINGAVQVGAGLMLALGRFPRLSSALLAGSLVPTTLAGHRFWEEQDETKRAQQRIHFFKNLSMLGGLMLAAVDTEGRPGLAWRAQHAAQHASTGTRRTTRTARREARLAARAARAHLPG
jgi:uncharacterized membrane protein YphA (DoxX/SURF4 family)